MCYGTFMTPTTTTWQRIAIDSTVKCEAGCSATATARWEPVGGAAPDGTIRTYRCDAHPADAPTPFFPYFASLCEHGAPVLECGCREVSFGHPPECACHDCDPEPDPDEEAHNIYWENRNSATGEPDPGPHADTENGPSPWDGPGFGCDEIDYPAGY